jgi:TPP-dependent pyruvate/acetoin dehydrogenase alpha subunit
VFDVAFERDVKLGLYRTMVRIRSFESGVRRLVRDGQIPSRFGFYTGQEAVASGVCAHLGAGDQIGSTHRPLGHLVAKGCDPRLLMAELCGKRAGLNKGKAGPYHVFDPSVGALGANGIVGGSVPLTAGYALTHQMRGDGGVAVAFFGEGASNQGRDPQLGIEKVSDRAAAYGMPGSTHVGWDTLEVYRAAGEAVRRARGGGGPTLLEFKVHQIEGNLEGRLEAREDERAWCPVHRLRERLLDEGALSQEEDRRIGEEERIAVEEAIEFAIHSPAPEPADAFRDVFEGGG